MSTSPTASGVPRHGCRGRAVRHNAELLGPASEADLVAGGVHDVVEVPGLQRVDQEQRVVPVDRVGPARRRSRRSRRTRRPGRGRCAGTAWARSPAAGRPPGRRWWRGRRGRRSGPQAAPASPGRGRGQGQVAAQRGGQGGVEAGVGVAGGQQPGVDRTVGRRLFDEHGGPVGTGWSPARQRRRPAGRCPRCPRRARDPAPGLVRGRHLARQVVEEAHAGEPEQGEQLVAAALPPASSWWDPPKWISSAPIASSRTEMPRASRSGGVPDGRGSASTRPGAGPELTVSPSGSGPGGAGRGSG